MESWRKLKKGQRFFDLTGETFGSLFVIEKTKNNPGDKHIRWKCRCNCGNICIKASNRLIRPFSDVSLSCGCLREKKQWKGYRDISGTYWAAIKANAKNRGIALKITIRDIFDIFVKQNKRCALSGMPIAFEKWKNSRKQTASLDRKNSAEPYIKKNIQLVHKDINRMKNYFNDKKFIELCKIIADFRKDG